MIMYALRDAEGKFVGRPRSLAAAHRATRRANMVGASVQPAPKLRYLGDVIGNSSHFGQCPRCGIQHMSTHERVSEEGAGRFGHGYLCERCAYSVAGDANRAGGAGLEWIRVEGKGKPNINDAFQVRADDIDNDVHAKVWYYPSESERGAVWKANVADEYYEGEVSFDGTSDGLNAAIKDTKKLVAQVLTRSLFGNLSFRKVSIKSGYKASTPTATESGMERRLRRLTERNRAGTSMEVAETILAQLGGAGRLRAMISAHTFVGGENRIHFRWRLRAKNGANAITITLMPSDTYKVEFISLRGMSMKVKGSFEDIYADGLIDLFERETGLYLRM